MVVSKRKEADKLKAEVEEQERAGSEARLQTDGRLDAGGDPPPGFPEERTEYYADREI